MAGILTNANYINNTIKPAIKSAIEAQGVTVPSTDSFLDYADRIAEIEGGGGDGYVLQDLPTGSISSFSDGVDLPLNSLKVSIEAVQSGSGAPSPSNIRPISGWSEANLWIQTTVDPTADPTATADFNTTIYGGSANLLTGEGVITHASVTYDGSEDEQWAIQNFTNTASAYIDISGKKVGYQLSICDKALNADGSWGDNVNFGRFSDHPTLTRTYFNRPNADMPQFFTLSDWKTYLSNNNLQIKYELAEPIPFTFTPIPTTNTLEGTNNIWADCGDVIDGEYFSGSAPKLSKVDYTIGSGSQPILADGRYLSGFASMSGYGAFPRDAEGDWLDVDWSDDFEIGIRFKLTSLSNMQTFFGDGGNGSYYKAPIFGWYQPDQKLWIGISNNGSSLALDQELTYAISADVWYFAKMIFIKSTLSLKMLITTDMVNFTTLYDNTLSSAPYHDAALLCLGGRARSASEASDTCIIDTYNTYIKDSSGSIVWGAYKGA